jgi:hypothetical protein
METKYTIQFRKQTKINTDPKRRCYNGHHYSSEIVWTPWKNICTYDNSINANDSMNIFAETNPTQEYRIISTNKEM